MYSVEQPATDSLIGLSICLTWTKCRRQGGTSSRPPSHLGDDQDLGPSTCRPPAIARPRHWSSSLHLHAVTPLPGPARPTNMLPSNRRSRTTHPHGFPTTGSALAICHILLRWPCCHPSLYGHMPGLVVPNQARSVRPQIAVTWETFLSVI